ncbi:MAG: class D sortase [Gorillibacterium sp.]|nr:class D sortase [Gorillibacterium sp.]
MLKKLSYVLIIGGIMVILWPRGSEWFNDLRQKHLLEQIEQEVSPNNEEALSLEKKAEYDRLSLVFEQESLLESSVAPQQASPSPTDTEEADVQAKVILRIDKINLKLPVLEGATNQNMKFAATHMTETTPFDEIGNAAIAAHRSRTKGRLFNRLNELEIGDKIILQMKNKQVEYTVFKVLLVDPTDISVLKSNNTDQVLTLITCDPVVQATHRLIVQAKI